METGLAIINESFDSILGANSGSSSRYTAWRHIHNKSKLNPSEQQNLEKLLDGLHAGQHSLRNILSCNRLTSYYYIKNIHI